ncbi:MAG: zf-HC2 domain-containing protein [Candidatus Eisenbacteria bacterium]|nr:zf-HC2 domain-containing protein [Candidatus Eisenbacteria bacterium]
MRCDDVKRRLAEFMEEELEASEQAAVLEHLATCDACASELAAYERTMMFLEDDGYVEPDSFYWTRFQAGLRARLRDRGRRFVFVPRFENLTPRLAPIVAAVLLFGVGLGVGLQPVLNVVGTSDSSGTYVERTTDDRGPVVSPRSKSLVESGGLAREMAQYAVNAADTLRPESFDSAIEQPQIILATDESWPAVERRLGE